MRILVCFKIVRDLDTVIESDWETAKDAAFRISYTKKQINEADQGALEAALRIRDENPQAELCAVTVGDDAPDSFMTGLFAVGFDRCVQIMPQEDLTYRPLETARLLSQFAVQNGPYDVIITGAQAPPGDSRQVPYALSEYLGLQCIDHVRSAAYHDGVLSVEREILPVRETYETKRETVLVMENPRYSYLRIPTLRERMKVSGKKAQQEMFPLSDIQEAAVTGLSPARTKRDCRFLTGCEARQILPLLFAEQEKKSREDAQ